MSVRQSAIIAPSTTLILRGIQVQLFFTEDEHEHVYILFGLWKAEKCVRAGTCRIFPGRSIGEMIRFEAE